MQQKTDLDHETEKMQTSTEEDFRIGIGARWLYQYINETSIKFAEGAEDSGTDQVTIPSSGMAG